MDYEVIIEKLNDLEKLIKSSKKVLTANDLSSYCGFSKSHIYKLVARNEIPYSKPYGKTLFFDKDKIDEWLLKNPTSSKHENQKKAQSYVFQNKRF